MTKLTNPTPLFLNARGTLLDAGYIYVGVAGADPEDEPIQVYWDFERSKPADQPLRTLGGVIVNGVAPAPVFMAEADYSLRVRDADGNQISYEPTLYPDLPDYQPLDVDLTLIAALTTTAFGRNLLTLASQAALRSATGIPDPLPLAGGTVTGNIQRAGAGAHTYHVNNAFTSGRIFGPEYTSDPTTAPGDIWLKANG